MAPLTNSIPRPRYWLRRAVAALALVTGAGCSAVDVVNALTPRVGYQRVRDIPYGADARQTLDVYMPAGADRAPVLVFFYGGNWDSGAKADYRFVAQAFTSRGFVVVIPDYRLYPAVRYPAFLDDGAKAARWVWDNIGRYGGDRDRLFLGGHSAGAYNAAMLGLDGRWLAKVDLNPDQAIKGVVGLAGPYDFLPITDPTLQIIFGPSQSWPETQPIRYVHPGAPAFFLAAGSADKTVDPGNVDRLEAALRRANVPVETRVYGGIGHAELAGALSFPLRFLAPVLADSAAFMAAVATTECVSRSPSCTTAR
jgi:acetyl esterase/lipase